MSYASVGRIVVGVTSLLLCLSSQCVMNLYLSVPVFCFSFILLLFFLLLYLYSCLLLSVKTKYKPESTENRSVRKRH